MVSRGGVLPSSTVCLGSYLRCEIESTLERLRKLERELYSKERELEERERRLKLWEERLIERSSMSPSPTSLLMERTSISPVSTSAVSVLKTKDSNSWNDLSSFSAPFSFSHRCPSVPPAPSFGHTPRIPTARGSAALVSAASSAPLATETRRGGAVAVAMS